MVYHITLPIIFGLLVWIFVIDPILTPILEETLDELTDSKSIVCPPEFESAEFELCLSGDGTIFANGKIDEHLQVELHSNVIDDTCSVAIGKYDFEATNCRFANLKSAEAFDIIVLSSKGTLSLNSKGIERYVSSQLYIKKITPKEYSFFYKLLRFWKFIPK